MEETMKKAVHKIVRVILAGVLSVSMITGSIFLIPSCPVQAASSISGVSTVSNMTSDFARGVDISAVTALENSGAVFYYPDGTSGDIFDILKGAGVNYVRIRIWNNPYDSSSPYKGYGAGNTDLYNAELLGKRATAAGMKVFIDFHYSDFWADPAKQFAPKAWSAYSLAYKKTAVYNFTYQSLCTLLNDGIDIGMVQIGNETNGSMCGIGGLYDGTWNLSTGVAALMQQGCYAVDDANKAYSKSMLKVLHFTDLLTNGEWYAKCLSEQGVDYDVFSTSFYPMWHGTTSDMTTVLTNIATTYNKKVMVSETAYPYTYDDADGETNAIYGSAAMNYTNYAVSAAGQAQALHDVFAGVAAVNNTKSGYGIGAFYWEPEWVPVSSSTWGTYGSGWATSSSGNYELLYSSAVNYYSTSDCGTQWDNMTLFDSTGKAMSSLYVFNDICGASSTTSSGSSSSSGSSAASAVLNLNSNSLTAGTYTSNISSGSFTIGASSSKNVAVRKISKTVNGTAYTKVLQMNGAGSSSGRYISFTTTGAATVAITAASTSSSSSRVIRTASGKVGGTSQGDLTFSGTASQQTISVSSAGTYYIYSTSCGIYVYDVTVTE